MVGFKQGILDNNIDFHVPFYRNPRLLARIIILVMLGVVLISSIVNIFF